MKYYGVACDRKGCEAALLSTNSIADREVIEAGWEIRQTLSKTNKQPKKNTFCEDHAAKEEDDASSEGTTRGITDTPKAVPEEGGIETLKRNADAIVSQVVADEEACRCRGWSGNVRTPHEKGRPTCKYNSDGSGRFKRPAYCHDSECIYDDQGKYRSHRLGEKGCTWREDGTEQTPEAGEAAEAEARSSDAPGEGEG